MAERTARRVVVEVDEVPHLFEATAFELTSARPRVVAALEEAYAAARAGHHRDPVVLEVRLPADQLVALDQSVLRTAIAAYCGLRAREVDHERDALVRDGRHSMGTGLLILAAGLIISQSLHHADLPEEIDTFLADGVFLVLAWVGLWYPLDTLLYGRREAGRRADAWRDVQNATVTFAPLPG